MAAPQSQFRSDLSASAVACASAPWLLVITVVIQAGPVALDAAARNRSLAFLATVAGIVELLTIGFYGTQRVWLFRLYRDRGLSLAEGWTLTKDYFRRFFSLAVRVFLPVGVVIAAVAISTRDTTAILVTAGVMSYVLDTLLTFVVPELTFRTASAGKAWTRGRAMLKDTWPASRWYVLAPGLAVIAVANVLGGAHRSVWAAGAVATMAALLSLVFRGAILSYYLRLLPDIPDEQPARGKRATG